MNEIDNVLKSTYENKKYYGELSSLYKLFSEDLSKAIKSDLKDVLNFPNNKPNAFDKIYVDFQWIDKIPLASFVNKQEDLNKNEIKNKTEIGDLFIQYRHSNAYSKNNQEKIYSYSHRALVVQAKLANCDNPIVPIGSVNKKRANSTSKELKLLEDWPEFDMYETSRNLDPLAKNIAVQLQEKPFAFYGGFTNKSKSWSFGKAKNSEVCKLSFGDIIFDLAKGNIGKEIKNDNAWETVSTKIKKSCINRKIPPSISDKIEPRHKSTSINGSVAYSFPLPMLQFLFETFLSFFRKKKIGVLFIDIVSYEGPDMNKYRNSI